MRTRLTESDGFGVEGTAGGGGGDGEVARETHGVVVQVSVAEELEAAESQGAEIELGFSDDSAIVEKKVEESEVSKAEKGRNFGVRFCHSQNWANAL